MTQNRLHPSDSVRVELYFDGKMQDAYEGSGYHTVTEAIEAAVAGTDVNHLNPEDYVFKVTDLNTGTSARYRINAGGHVTLLPEVEA